MLAESVQRVALHDGRACVLRPTRADDAAALLALERAIVRAREGVVKHEDELPADAAAYAQRLGASLAAWDGVTFRLAAEVEGDGIVGEATLARIPLRMLRHVAVFSVGVHPAAQRLGVGRAMLRAALHLARTHRDPDGGRILRVELYTRADNHRARALYEQAGFALEGVRRGFIRRDDGALIDDLVMGLRIDDAG